MRVLFLVCITFFSFSLSAQELEEGKVYSGGATVTLKEQGIAVKVPKGWAGGVSGEYFVLQKSGVKGLIAVYVDRASQAEAKAFLSSAQQLPGGFYYSPTSKPTVSGDVVSSKGSVVEGMTQYKGQIDIKTSAHGFSVAVIAIATEESALPTVLKAAAATTKSAKLTKPKIPKPGQFFGPWVGKVKNKRLTYMKTGDTVSDTRKYTFCADGSFSYYGSSSGFSKTDFYDGSSVSASHVGNQSEQGKWAIAGDKIYLWWDTGETGKLVISTNSKGNLFLNNTRYFRDGDACQ